MKWYVLNVESGMDDKVKKAITTGAKIRNLTHLIGNVLIPKQRVQRFKKTGEPFFVNLKRYPGYLIVQAVHCKETFLFIDGLKGVLGYLPHRTRLIKDEIEEGCRWSFPVPLKDEEAALAILQSTSGYAPKEIQVHIKPGDKVTVLKGSLAGVEATVKEMGGPSENPMVMLEFPLLGILITRTIPYWMLKA